MHTSQQSRSAWTEQEDDMLRAAVAKYGDRAWATVALDVPGRSSKSCSDRWRNFLSPEIEHPRKIPFSEWEVAVVVQAQHRYGNNWKAISMLLPGRTNRAVKNLFVGNLKWGARLPEIQNRYLETRTPLEDLLEVTPEYPGGPPKERPGLAALHASAGAKAGAAQRSAAAGAGAAATAFAAPSASSAGSAWASEATEQAFAHHHHHHAAAAAAAASGGFGPAVTTGLRRPHHEAGDAGGGSPTAAGCTTPLESKRLRLDAEGHSGPSGAGTPAAVPLAFGLEGLPMMAAAPHGGPAFMVPLMLAPDAAAHLQPLFGAGGMDAAGAPLGCHLSPQQQPPCALLGGGLAQPQLQHAPQTAASGFAGAPTIAAAAAAAATSARAADAHAAAAIGPTTGGVCSLDGSLGGAALLLANHPSNDSAMLAEIVGSILGDDDGGDSGAAACGLVGGRSLGGGISLGGGGISLGGGGISLGGGGISLGGGGGISGGGGLLLFNSSGGDDCALLHGSGSGGSGSGGSSGGAAARASAWPRFSSLGLAAAPAPAQLAVPPPPTPGGAMAAAAPAHPPEPTALCQNPSRCVSTGDVLGKPLAPAGIAPASLLIVLPPTPQPGGGAGLGPIV